MKAKVLVSHGPKLNCSKGSYPIYTEKYFKSRKAFMRYMEILPKDHWRQTEFVGKFKEVSLSKALRLIKDKDEFIMCFEPENDEDQIGFARSSYLLKNSEGLYKLILENCDYEFYRIKNANQEPRMSINMNGEIKFNG